MSGFVSEVRARDYDLAVGPQTVWLQTAGALFGNVTEKYGEDWQQNIAQALGILSLHTSANNLITMKPGDSVFKDLDREKESSDSYGTNGLITTDPNQILHARPADCGEIATQGYSTQYETDVIALLHYSSKIVGNGSYLKALEYLCETHGISPVDLTVRLSPTAKMNSYKFSDIDDEQKKSWGEFVEEDAEGSWRVGFHERAVRELRKFGIPIEMIFDAGIDTIADRRYFSWYQHNTGGGKSRGEKMGGNGLFYALRGANTVATLPA